MDLTNSIIPKSDQQNFEDYLNGPRTVTISAVHEGNAEQPAVVELVEYPGRPYKPNKTMRKIMVRAWGADTTKYVGHQMKLVGNPEVQFAGRAVGGIEIAAMSHIDAPISLPLTVTRGRKRQFTVKPLETTAPARNTDRVLVDEWISVINEAGTIAQLEAAWRGAIGADVAREPDVIAAKDDRKKELS